MYGSVDRGAKPQSGYGDVQKAATTTWSWGRPGGGYDVEAGQSLYPGLSAEDNVMRWAFIRKVYAILLTQLVATVVVVSAVVFSAPFRSFLLGTTGVSALIMFTPFIALGFLACYHQSHPINFVLLGIYTVSLALAVGVVCAYTPAPIVLEALILTTAIVVGLTLYTFHAAKQGQDFSFLGPALFSAVIVLILWSLIQMFFPAGPISRTIFALVGAIIFSGYIVYDTDNLLKRFTYDDYIWASAALYIDVINLFLYLLELLRAVQGGDR